MLLVIPGVAKNCPENLSGLGFGIAYGLTYIGTALMPISVIGPLLHNFDVEYTICFNVFLSIINLVLSFLWSKEEKQYQYNLKN